MRNAATIQDQYCSSYDKRKFCSYDIEFIDGNTKPLIHREARFLYFTKGKAKIVVDGKSYPIAQRSFVAIMPWQTTTILEVEEPLHFIKIIYNSNLITSTIKMQLNSVNSSEHVITSITNCPVLNLTVEESKIILNTMEAIKSEVGIDSFYDVVEEQELSKIYVTNKLIELLIHFNRYILKKECKTKSGTQIELDNRPLIFKYIYSHISNRLTLAKLSEIFYMSESALSKYIQDVTGHTFNDLVNEMRITKAIDLLTYTDLPLTDIAYLVGFSDAPHLVKVFTARMNLLPNEYRQIYKAKDHIFKEKDRSITFELIDYINENFTDEIRVTDVSKRFDLSVVEINRKLMFQLERNFEEYLHYLRVNRACELLLTTDMTIVQVGLEVGYNTIKTFNRNFVRLKNMTPGDFRKTINLQEFGESLPNDEKPLA